MDDLFANTFDSLDALTRRKQAIADPDRYRALYYVYERQDETVYEDALPTDDIDPLLNENLLAHVPTPDNRYIVRITTLGKQELEADLQHLR